MIILQREALFEEQTAAGLRHGGIVQNPAVGFDFLQGRPRCRAQGGTERWEAMESTTSATARMRASMRISSAGEAGRIAGAVDPFVMLQHDDLPPATGNRYFSTSHTPAWACILIITSSISFKAPVLLRISDGTYDFPISCSMPEHADGLDGSSDRPISRAMEQASRLTRCS